MQPLDAIFLHGSRSRGFSLIELMVGISIGLFIVYFILQGFTSASIASRNNSSSSEAMTNARYAMEFLKREIRHASSPRLLSSEGVVRNDTDPAFPLKDFGCGAGIVLLDQPIRGFTSKPYSCLSNGTSTYSVGDVLVLSRPSLQAAATDRSTSTYVANAPYVRLSYKLANPFVATASGPPTGFPDNPPWYDHALVNDIYFINSFTVSASEIPLVPSLCRLTLTTINGVTSLQREVIASNIENFIFQIGVQSTSDGSIQYKRDTTGVVWGSYIPVSVRFWLLARESEPEPGVPDSALSYTLGPVSYTPSSVTRYRRTVYSTTVALRSN